MIRLLLNMTTDVCEDKNRRAESGKLEIHEKQEHRNMGQGQWLRDGERLPDGETAAFLYVAGDCWQLYTTASGGYALAARRDHFRRALRSGSVQCNARTRAKKQAKMAVGNCMVGWAAHGGRKQKINSDIFYHNNALARG